MHGANLARAVVTAKLSLFPPGQDETGEVWLRIVTRLLSCF
jgi:hypothetical protein